MSKETQKTIISWTPTGVNVQYPALPQREDPECPVMEDGKVSFKSSVPNPGAADRVCKLSTKKGTTTLGVFSNGPFNTATVFDSKNGAYGESGPLRETEQIQVLDKDGRPVSIVNIGPKCGLIDGDCEISSITQANQEALPPPLSPTSEVVPVVIVGLAIGVLYLAIKNVAQDIKKWDQKNAPKKVASQKKK